MAQTLDLTLTRHESARMRQRGIPHFALKCLLDFRRPVHDHRGAELIVFDTERELALGVDLGLGW